MEPLLYFSAGLVTAKLGHSIYITHTYEKQHWANVDVWTRSQDPIVKAQIGDWYLLPRQAAIHIRPCDLLTWYHERRYSDLTSRVGQLEAILKEHQRDDGGHTDPEHLQVTAEQPRAGTLRSE